MSARRIGWAIGAATLAASAAYMFIYLYRWEWNRALTAGLFFLAAEVGLASAFLADRIRRLESRLGETTGTGDPRHAEVRSRIAEASPPSRDRFAWMESHMQRTSVFIPVLMGAGVMLSALAWVVERVARVTAKPAMESKLAAHLLPITLPAGPIVSDDEAVQSDTGLALLLRPRDGDRR